MKVCKVLEQKVKTETTYVVTRLHNFHLSPEHGLAKEHVLWKARVKAVASDPLHLGIVSKSVLAFS